MNKKVVATVLVFALIAAGLVAAGETGKFSIRELLGLEPAGTAVAEEAAPAANWAQPASEAEPLELALDDIQQVMRNLDVRQRQALLADQETFKRFVRQEADNLSILAAARANNVDKDANTRFLMQRSAENVLRETYLNRLVTTKLPAGFPSDEQVREYYEKNKDKFVLGERVHVWQIFLPVDPAADEKAVEAVRRQAEAIVKDLNANTITFGDAASKYSQHEPSRFNAGYMGLIRVDELREEIRKPLMALQENRISSPVRSDSGIHILKRGAVVPAQSITFEDVKDEVRQLLQRQAQTQLRQAIYEQARKSYPVEVTDARVEEWRLRLRTNLQAAAQPGGQKADDKKDGKGE